MRSPLFRPAGAAAVGLMLLSGCDSGSELGKESPSAETPTQAPSAASPAPTTPLAPGEVGVSPGGVTTAMGAPADSTEDDYYQACRAARTWMEEQGGDPHAQIEPYLATVQGDGQAASPATLGRPWSELSPGQQSAVIVAVEAAADAMCG